MKGTVHEVFYRKGVKTLATKYYALLYTAPDDTLENPCNIMKVIDEPGKFTIERLNEKGEWVEDMNPALAPGAEPIAAEQAGPIIQRTIERRKASH